MKKNISHKSIDLSKKLIFEVLTRDQFTCQICHKSVLEATLKVDKKKIWQDLELHSEKPQRYITYCNNCLEIEHVRTSNQTKLIKKNQKDPSKTHLDELQERREQFEMLIESKLSISDRKDKSLLEICQYWEELAPGYLINRQGKEKISRWLEKFNSWDISSAMDKAANEHLDFYASNKVTGESWEQAFNQIHIFCETEHQSKDEIEKKKMFLLRFIINDRLLHTLNNEELLKILKERNAWNIRLDDLQVLANEILYWNTICNSTDPSAFDSSNVLQDIPQPPFTFSKSA